MKIFAVGLQMLGELIDALGEHGHLDFWRTSVFAVGLIARNDLLLAFCQKCHYFFTVCLCFAYL